MTIATRLEDAVVLMEQQRWEGALLSVLVAISGTARRRFPQGTASRWAPSKAMGDREAFETFVTEQIPSIAKFTSFNMTFQGQVRPIGEVLYRWMRCTLAHEAGLPPEIDFVPDSTRGRIDFGHRVGPLETIFFSHSLVVLLGDLVARAPENAADVPSSLRERIMRFVRLGAASEQYQYAASHERSFAN
jgi:hypothetical protein